MNPLTVMENNMMKLAQLIPLQNVLPGFAGLLELLHSKASRQVMFQVVMRNLMFDGRNVCRVNFNP